MNELFCSHDMLRMASQSGPPTSVSFDNCHEAIHVGWSNGEISTYRASCLNDNLINWSAFPAHRTSVLQSFGACDIGLFSLSSDRLKIHTQGGMQLFEKRSLDVGNNKSNFTCMVMTSAEKVLCGTKAAGIVECDVHANSALTLLGGGNACMSATKLKVAPFNPRLVYAGSVDGTIAVLDTRMNGQVSSRGDFKATTGGRVSDLDVNSSSLMVSTGYSSKNVLEQYIKVFDLRMNNRQLNPIHFAAPVGVHFLQDGSYSNVLAASATGALRIADASTSNSLQFGNVTSGGGKLQASAASFTGLSFALVDTDSFIHFWETCPQYRNVCQDLFLEEPHPSNASAFRYLSSSPSALYNNWHSSEVAMGRYAAGMDGLDPLLSTTLPDSLLNKTIKPSPKAVLKIKPELLAKMDVARQHGVMGYLPNETGFPGNSVLFTPARAALVYDSVDPRRSSSSKLAEQRENKSLARKRGGAAAANASNGEGEMDYGLVNPTRFAGLEQVDFDPSASSFSSAVLQALYFIPAFRNLCVARNDLEIEALPVSIPAELNMLFRMLDTARAALPSKLKCCLARNFIVALRAAPDAIALGLVHMAASPIQSCAKLMHFILSQFDPVQIEPLFATQVVLQGGEEAKSTLRVIDLVASPATTTLEEDIHHALHVKRRAVQQLAPYLIFNCADLQLAAGTTAYLCSKFAVTEEHGIVSMRNDSAAQGQAHYELVTCISLLPGRTVAHIKLAAEYTQYGDEEESLGRRIAAGNWLRFDDARVEECTLEQVLDGGTARPLLLIFKRAMAQLNELVSPAPMSLDVFAASPIPCSSSTAAAGAQSRDYIPPTVRVQPGDFVAMDCEFVALTNDVVEVNPDGSKIVTSPRQLALARVSVVDSNFNILIDDLVLPTQRPVDYLTRFSGLVDGDLDAGSSTHSARLFAFRAVYAKLLYLAQRGCIFVGHGLDSDFKVVNMLLPPGQIRDTVQLFWLRGKRKLGLRFLTSVVLQQSIQDRGTRGHDSIQDAVAALRLYFKYRELEAKPLEFQHLLQRVYMEGPARNWS